MAKRNFIEGEEALRMVENMQPRRNSSCVKQKVVCCVKCSKLLPLKWGRNSIQFRIEDPDNKLDGASVFATKKVANDIFNSTNTGAKEDFYIVNRTYVDKEYGTEYEMFWVATLSIF